MHANHMALAGRDYSDAGPVRVSLGQLQDSDANPIPGVASQPLDANGGVNLSGLPLTSTLPQFLLTLEGSRRQPR